jgi:hypothetical protein
MLTGRVLWGSRPDGATDGATVESSRQRTRMNTGSPVDWEVMIEHVTRFEDVSGRPGWSHPKPQIAEATGVSCFQDRKDHAR